MMTMAMPWHSHGIAIVIIDIGNKLNRQGDSGTASKQHITRAIYL